jgi:hypothetical protein
MNERTAAAPAGWPAARARHGAARAAAIALHALLLWALCSGLGRVEMQRPAREVWTTLVAVAGRTLPARAQEPAPAQAQARAPARTPVRPRAPAATAAPPTNAPVPGEPQAITLPQAPPASAALASATPASAPPAPIGSILDTEATRAAIRAAARGPLLSERVAAATGIALTAGANERLSNDVDAAHHGDCMHGDFAGSGGVLLSLPFLALAEVTGKCAK